MERELHGNLYAETSSEDEFPTDDDSSDGDEDDTTDEDFAESEYRYGRKKRNQKKNCVATISSAVEAREENVNLLKRLYNRELTGHFSGNARCRQTSYAFNQVPSRLGFCLKEVIPYCYLQGHMFMGLSSCGQFMLSYKVCANDNVASNHYSFNIGYKYTLYFWVYQPHKPFRRFFKTCLFDDHGVDNLKEVTMVQWKCSNNQILIVHGAGENENEDSYITYVKVPKLGCLDCKKLREVDECGNFCIDLLCLKCNLTVHTKYSTSESDPAFDPYINLICPERILIIANGFVHMLHIELETTAVTASSANSSTSVHGTQIITSQHTQASPHQSKVVLPHESVIANVTVHASDRLSTINATGEDTIGCDNQNNIVARIIADFSDIENDATSTNNPNNNEIQRFGTQNHDTGVHSGSVTCVSRKTYDELIFTCAGNSAKTNSNGSGGSLQSSLTNNNTNSNNSNTVVGNSNQARVSLINFQGRRNHRIVTKSYRNGVTIDLPGTTSPSSTADKSNAYEFSEDNEKCEKIATFRKRRLADKKYEFSEDNSENIIPFTKIRSAARTTLTTALYGSASSSSNGFSGSPSTGRGLYRSTASSHHFYNSPCVSPSSSPHASHSSNNNTDNHSLMNTPPVQHRSSPIGLQQGFFSPPCGSPVGAGRMRSPGRHVAAASQFYQQYSPPTISPATQQMLSFKPLTTLSPLQVSVAKRSHFEIGGHTSPNANVPFLSPRREEYKIIEVPIQSGLALEKPICTKKFKRRYVEEDDATSVITSEEDDCISPGYHTSLPMEVHGSCYSEMQMISQATYQQLRPCASVVVTQHSFDLETFTYYVTSKLCQKNNKIYDVFYDWAYELISICPHSNNIICMLIVQFVVRDPSPCAPNNCMNCQTKSNLGCTKHRKPCECRILFTWNMESGVWEVLDYGELVETKNFDVVTPANKSGRTGLNLAATAKKLAHELRTSLCKMQNYSKNLRVLDSNVSKSKASLTDLDNTIEFYLKRPRNSE